MKKKGRIKERPEGFYDNFDIFLRELLKEKGAGKKDLTPWLIGISALLGSGTLLAITEGDEKLKEKVYNALGLSMTQVSTGAAFTSTVGLGLLGGVVGGAIGALIAGLIGAISASPKGTKSVMKERLEKARKHFNWINEDHNSGKITKGAMIQKIEEIFSSLKEYETGDLRFDLFTESEEERR